MKQIEMKIARWLLAMLTSCVLTESNFTDTPPDGNWLEFHPLILQWHHTFQDIRGCMWYHSNKETTPKKCIIRFGTNEGLEVKQLGWELTNINEPCYGGIRKENGSKSDEGFYEFRVVAKGKISTSSLVKVHLINQADRSIQVMTDTAVTVLLPGTDIDRTVVIGDYTNVSIKLNDKYPNTTCFKVCTYRHESLRRVMDVCNKTFNFKKLHDADLTSANISVNMDIVDFTTFNFTILLKETDKDQQGAANVGQDTSPLTSWTTTSILVSGVIVGGSLLLFLLIGIVIVVVHHNRRIQKDVKIIKGLPTLARQDSEETSLMRKYIESFTEKMNKPKWTRHLAILDFGIIGSGEVILSSSLELAMLNPNGEVMDMQITPDVSCTTNIAVNNQSGDIAVGRTSGHLSEELHVYSNETSEWKLQNRFELEESAVNCITWMAKNDIVVFETSGSLLKQRSYLSRYTMKGENVWRKKINPFVIDITVDSEDNIFRCCSSKQDFYI